MTDFKTDEEKAEELKAWWKDNGTSVMAGGLSASKVPIGSSSVARQRNAGGRSAGESVRSTMGGRAKCC